MLNVTYQERTFTDDKGTPITYRQLYINGIPVKVCAGKASSYLHKILCDMIDSDRKEI